MKVLTSAQKAQLTKDIKACTIDINDAIDIMKRGGKYYHGEPITFYLNGMFRDTEILVLKRFGHPSKEYAEFNKLENKYHALRGY